MTGGEGIGSWSSQGHGLGDERDCSRVRVKDPDGV
jgi:hypothetical protein